MKKILNLLTIVSLAATSAFAAETLKLDPNGAYVIRIERPFVKEYASWLPLRVNVQFKDGQGTTGGAFSTQFNNCWHPVDAAKLRLAEGKISGEMVVDFRYDSWEKYGHAWSQMTPEEQKKYTDKCWKPHRPERASVPIRVDCPVAAEPFAGAAPGTASWEKAEAWMPAYEKKGTAPARAWAAPSPDPAKPLYLEVALDSWSFDSNNRQYDSIIGSAVIILRGRVEQGKLTELRTLGTVFRFTMELADQLWDVADSSLAWDGTKLTGAVTLRKGRNLTPNYEGFGYAHKLPEGPLMLSIKAERVGDRLFGSAQCAYDIIKHETTVKGAWRNYPFAIFADRTPREVKPDLQPDPALVEIAKQEALVPIRPGEPGKAEFWSWWARMGGCSFRQVPSGTIITGNPKRDQFLVQDGPIKGGNWVTRLMPYWEFIEMKSRARVESSYLAQGPFADQGPAQWSFIAAPTFDLPETAGAVKYRFTIVDWRKKQEVASFQADKPWRPLTPVWDKLPAGNYEMEVTGLDAGGQPVGKPQKVGLPKRTPFDGPYYTSPRTITEAALMHARWMRDTPRATFARGLNCEVADSSDFSDGQLWCIICVGAHGPLVVHALSQDPGERADALEYLVNTADLYLKNFSTSPLPDAYKGWPFDHWVTGYAWLELYRITGDPQYADAAKLLAKRLGEGQIPSGAWTETWPPTGKPHYDEKTGMYHPGSGMWPQEYDPSTILYFLGRIRKELKTDEFKPIEDKAWQFQVDNTLVRFDFRRQGPSESRRNKHPWKCEADNAIHLFNYLALDLPDRTIDWKLMEDLARWSEDRAVEWTRPGQGVGLNGGPVPAGQLTPYALEENTPTVRMAEMYAKLAAHTGNKLHKAKAEALVSTALATQNPVSGQIHGSFDARPEAQGTGCGDGGARGEYTVLSLWRLAQLWEGKK